MPEARRRRFSGILSGNTSRCSRVERLMFSFRFFEALI
jgi:hypothetical protein